MKRIFIILLILTIVLSGCGSKSSSSDEINEIADNIENQSTAEPQTAMSDKAQLSTCGDVYSTGVLSYNIIGVQRNDYSDGISYLLLNLELYNETDQDMTYSALDRLALYGDSGQEYPLDLLADVETGLGSQILAKNKMIGDVAFDITDSTDDVYILNIGKSFEYKPAIQVTVDQIGQTYAEQFESKAIQSEYTIGVPVESEQLTILLKGVSIEDSNKEGMDQLNCELCVTNNTAETQNFMLGINLKNAYTADGQTLDSRGAKITLPTLVEPGETISGIIPYYIPKGETAFYITTIPDLNDYSHSVNIAFEVQ